MRRCLFSKSFFQQTGFTIAGALISIIFFIPNSSFAAPCVSIPGGTIEPDTDCIILTSTADAEIRSGSPGSNFGTNTDMQVSEFPTGRNGLLQFDLSSIPQGATITSAELKLRVTAVGSSGSEKYYALHRILSNWDESTVTWNTPGSTAGTHFTLLPSTINTSAITSANAWTTFDVTTDITGFHNGTFSNYGWRILWSFNASGASNVTDFATRENGSAGQRPSLTVNFVPLPASKLAITSVNSGTNPTAGQAFDVVVQAQDAFNSPRFVLTDTAVTLSLASGSGTFGGTLTGTILAGKSSTSISGVTYTKAQSGVKLSASRTSGDVLTSAISSSFTVNPASVDHFIIEKSGGGAVGTQAAQIPFGILITAKDAFENLASGFTGTVGLATTAGTITPTTSGTFTAGVRTENVTLNHIGAGKTISADDGSGHTGTSNVFETICAIKIGAETCFGNIQTAIGAANSGSTIEIAAGTYTLSSDITIDKSVTLAGPNTGISPRNGGASRVSEAVINGGAPGAFNGSSGYKFNLAAGVTSLTVTGLKFTNFDGNIFASSLVPVASVSFNQNIFDTNNGGLFYKFDTSIGTDFDVTDNLIANQSMATSNTALFFLGNVANSDFDDNEATNVSSRELFNIYDELASTSFSGNVLTNTAGLLGLYASQSGVVIDSNTLTTVTQAGGAAIYIGTNDGHSVSNLSITNNTVTAVNGASGIIVACDTAGAASITDVLIQGNTVNTSLYGITVDTFQNGTGTTSGVAIKNNTLTNNSFSPILVYSRPNPSSGLNSVSGITIQNNTFNVSAAIYTSSFYLIDLRNVAGTNTFTGNSLTLSGILPGGTDAVRALAIRGSRTGIINITGNTLNGGGVAHNNAPTVPVTGMAILSKDSSTGNIPSTAIINATGNTVNGWENGVTVRDGVTPAYGGLATGMDVNFNNNNLGGNLGYSIQSGAGETIDATSNWWGATEGVGSKIFGSVSFDPWYLNQGKTVLSNTIVSGVLDATTGNFDTAASSSAGAAGLPSGVTEVKLSDSTALDLSNNTSTAAGDTIVVAGASLSLSNFTSGTLSGVNIATAQTVGGTSVLVGKAVRFSSGASTQPIILRNGALSNAAVSIPDDTTVLAPAGWNSKITPPKSASSSGTPPSGFVIGNTVIEVGSPDAVLLFDKPVALTLSGVTGEVGYKPAGSGTWAKIDQTCGGTFASPADPVFPGECKISNGNDTKIFTYHFTTFGSLTTPPPPPSGGGGGGGGGYQIAQASPTPSPSPTPSVTPYPSWEPKPTPVPTLKPARFLQLATDLVPGMRGEDVRRLQQFLASDPSIYPEGLVTGYYGSLTTAAVKRLQARYGVVQLGRVGPETREKLLQAGLNGIFIQKTPVTPAKKPDGALVRYSGSPKVYILDAGKKRWVPTAEDFAKLGYLWTSIITIPLSETYPDGTNRTFSAVPEPARPANTVIVNELDPGAVGDQVRLLQEFLAKDPSIYPEGRVTGYYGPLTTAAVRRFQAKYGISAVGRVGPETLKKINELITAPTPKPTPAPPSSSSSRAWPMRVYIQTADLLRVLVGLLFG